MSSRLARLVLQCSIYVAAAACNNDSNAIPCTMNDECVSHVCQANDTCLPVGSIDAGAPMDSPVDATDGGGGSGACTPNHDGMIEATELPLAAGASARYLIATNPTWDTTGSAGTDNARTWDLSGALSGDQDVPIALESPSGTWWGSDFPTASYASILSGSDQDLLGVFHVDPTGVTLIGVVSTSGGPTKTELTYMPAAQILAVPFMASSTWTSTSTVTGTLDGIATFYDETYASEVDEVGTMITPYGSFPVLRVATDLSRGEEGVNEPYNRTFAWVAECFGSVAQAQSQAYPDTVPTGEFSNPAEVWRITN